MPGVEKDYEELFGCLNKHKVKFCIVGAYAVAFHAVPRFTKDLDIFIEASEENAKRVIRALNEFGFSSLRLSVQDFSKPGKTIQLGYEPLRVDLLTEIDGRTFHQVWKNRKKGFYGKTKICFIGLSDLIRNKQVSKRKQDAADIETLQNLAIVKKKGKKKHS